MGEELETGLCPECGKCPKGCCNKECSDECEDCYNKEYCENI